APAPGCRPDSNLSANKSEQTAGLSPRQPDPGGRTPQPRGPRRKEGGPMSRRLGLLALAFFALPFLTFAVPVQRQKQWQQVDEAIKKGLPRTAIEHLNPIIEAAIKDKAYPEAIKAVARKIALEGNIQGNKPEEKITRMKAAIAKAPAEMRPVMDAILANWY